MNSAIGMIEMKTVSSGVTATDTMVKTAKVEIVEAMPVCPGKYIAIIKGGLSAVNASIEAVKGIYGQQLISSFILGNPNESIFPAIYGTVDVKNINALGILETYDAATIIVAADTAVKTAIVELIELRIAKGMCGKSYLFLTGEIAAIEAAIEKARQVAGKEGMYLDSSVIANPDKQIYSILL